LRIIGIDFQKHGRSPMRLNRTSSHIMVPLGDFLFYKKRNN
jgi:hypothetical protein